METGDISWADWAEQHFKPETPIECAGGFVVQVLSVKGEVLMSEQMPGGKIISMRIKRDRVHVEP